MKTSGGEECVRTFLGVCEIFGADWPTLITFQDLTNPKPFVF